MGERATLLYGIGAPKTGTSWLYSYLEGHPECAMPLVKEMHYFDTVEGVLANWHQDMLIRQITSQRDRVERIEAGQEEGRAPRVRRRIAGLERLLAALMIGEADPRAYLDVLYERAGEAKVVADFTPAYCMLPLSRLTMMAGLVEQTRFLFIMRDPVERFWSQCRFQAANRVKRGGAADVEKVANTLVDRTLRGEETEIFQRSDYASALTKLDALPRDTVKVLFYEDLFEQETLDTLCTFLGIASHKAVFNEPRNSSPALALDEGRRAALQRMLAPQYAAAHDKMGALPDGWSRNMERV